MNEHRELNEKLAQWYGFKICTIKNMGGYFEPNDEQTIDGLFKYYIKDLPIMVVVVEVGSQCVKEVTE